MIKKNILLVMGFLFVLSSCSNINTILQETGHVEVQAAFFEERIELDNTEYTEISEHNEPLDFNVYSWRTILEAYNIENYSIIESKSPLVVGMPEEWVAYDIYCIRGNVYLLILRKSDEDFVALINSDNILMEGIIDGGMLPKAFN